MEVELKKTKITKSIVDQSLSGGYNLIYHNLHFDILGWCLIKNIRKVLLYNRLTNQIFTLPYAKFFGDDIRIEDAQEQRSDGKGGWVFPTIKKVKIYCCDLHNTITFSQDVSQTFEDMENIFTKVKDFYKQVNQKGQIYL